MSVVLSGRKLRQNTKPGAGCALCKEACPNEAIGFEPHLVKIYANTCMNATPVSECVRRGLYLHVMRVLLPCPWRSFFALGSIKWTARFVWKYQKMSAS